MNGLMGMDVPEEFNYLWNPDKTTADLPVLLMAGCISGALIGILGGIITQRLVKFVKNMN